MNTELLICKAKRKDNGEWAYGYYYQIWGQGYLLWGMTNDVPNMIEVDPKTLCRPTGLRDKNGNKIWENDIVSFLDMYSTENGYSEHGCVGKVAWDDETISFQVTNRLSAESYEVLDECLDIGNIFDNPELLKGGAK